MGIYMQHLHHNKTKCCESAMEHDNLHMLFSTLLFSSQELHKKQMHCIHDQKQGEPKIAMSGR
jgi:hypothetical protein